MLSFFIYINQQCNVNCGYVLSVQISRKRHFVCVRGRALPRHIVNHLIEKAPPISFFKISFLDPKNYFNKLTTKHYH